MSARPQLDERNLRQQIRELRALAAMLRGRLEAIANEMTDAQHFLDEIEAALRPPDQPTEAER